MKDSPLVRIILPVYNEEELLDTSVRTLLDFLAESHFPYPYQLTIADNGSSDRTPAIARALADEFPTVSHLILSQKGKGHAIREGWKEAGDVLTFMDIDLASDLAYFRPLVDAVILGGADLAIGNRLGKDSRIEGRRAAREVASRGYNLIVRMVFGSPLDDHQCGFKAIRSDAYQLLASELTDTGWFFDTELLVLAERRGLIIKPIDICWADNRASKVSLVETSLDILKAVAHLEERLGARRGAWARFGIWWQIAKFLASGVAAAVVNLVLFALLVREVGVGYIPAVILTSVVVFIMSFVLQKFWTFDTSSRSALHHELAKFALSALATAGANVLLLAFFVAQIGLAPILAQLLSLALLALVNFFVYKFLIFRR